MCVLAENYFLTNTELDELKYHKLVFNFCKNLLYLKDGEKEPFLLLKLLGADPKNQNLGKSTPPKGG